MSDRVGAVQGRVCLHVRELCLTVKNIDSVRHCVAIHTASEPVCCRSSANRQNVRQLCLTVFFLTQLNTVRAFPTESAPCGIVWVLTCMTCV
jgi:hypothetical protein